MNNNIAKLIGLEDVILENVTTSGNNLEISISLPRKKHICPHCSCETDRIHDYRKQRIKDRQAFDRNVVLILRKRRYVCPHCGKRFFEKNSFLPRYHRMTQRCITAILRDMGDKVSAKHVAKENSVSCTTVWRYFDLLDYKCKSLPEVLSIDEFKGNADGEKYQTIVTDPAQKRILDILPNRYENELIRYFKQFSTRNSVKFFVIDMNDHFRRVGKTCFPKAKIVADRYHVVRQVFWAMENVRKNEQKRLSDKFRIYFKRSKALMYKNPKKLSYEEMNRLTLMFDISPRLARAYHLKNRFMSVMHSKDSTVGKRKLADWLFLAEVENIPEFRSCITAYRNWSEEILNSFDVPHSNGFTEGCNNKTKVIKRVSFGIRSFDRLRTRILHIANTCTAN